MSKRSEATLSGFACNCGEKQKKDMAELHEWVWDTFFSRKAKEPADIREDWAKEFYTTAMLHALMGYDAVIDGIYLDQWGAISTEGGLKREDHSYVQFDRFEDGLALTLKLYHDKYGSTYIERPDDEDDDEEAPSEP